jgi:arsenate reductase
MAEGFMKELGSDIFEVYSAGTEYYSAPKKLALEVMVDNGIDMSYAASKLLKDIPDKLDILVTMGCGVECPFVPTNHREDWGLEDPSGGPKVEFEKTRDIIRDKVVNLIERTKNGEM